MKKHYFVDLFAGCGGLSLGLENAGFAPAYVNELNRDAMQSYLMNRDDKHPMLRQKYHSYDIRELTMKKNALRSLVSGFKEDYGIGQGDLALVAGGPPCQGYSGIGHRRLYSVDKKDVPSNHLYMDMIKVIQNLNPKCFLFENVSGLLFGRWTPDGEKGEIWKDVEKAFSSIRGYKTYWALVHAKHYGVPQNRPRVLLIGMRNDIKIEEDPALPAKGLLPKPVNNYPHLVDLLGDLVDPDYLWKKSTEEYVSTPKNELQKKLRIGKDGKKLLLKGDKLTEQEYSNHSAKIRKKFEYMLKNEGEIPEKMKTKKFAQRVLPEHWDKKGPNITATSLPDDYVHFCHSRTLTVREWARLQMFPDWYCFAGKRTTGGQRRAGNPIKGIWDRDLPKYTQIGNAVPVKLAEVIGKHLAKLLS